MKMSKKTPQLACCSNQGYEGGVEDKLLVTEWHLLTTTTVLALPAMHSAHTTALTGELVPTVRALAVLRRQTLFYVAENQVSLLLSQGASGDLLL